MVPIVNEHRLPLILDFLSQSLSWLSVSIYVSLFRSVLLRVLSASMLSLPVGAGWLLVRTVVVPCSQQPPPETRPRP
eukprot:3128489-Rhodomonas_salina.2